jgi:hypothetical protein
LERHDLFDLAVRGFERLEHLVFGQLTGPALDHHDRVGRSRHDQVQS